MDSKTSKLSKPLIGACVLVVVAAIVAAALVLHFHKPASQDNSQVTTGSTSPTQSISQSSAQPVQPATQYVVIKEWGVEAPYSGSLTLSYTITLNGDGAMFSSSQLSALSNACIGSGGGIVRWASTDLVPAGTNPIGTDEVPGEAESQGATNTVTAEQSFANADPSRYTHIGNYYYYFVHAQSGCGDVSETATAEYNTNNAVASLVPKLQAIKN